MPRPKTKTTAQSVNDYMNKTYDRIQARIPKKLAAEFREACVAAGTNPNRLINEWVADFVAKSKN